MHKILPAIIIVCLALLSGCRAPENRKPLEGKWHVIGASQDRDEKVLPDEIEFFRDGTASLPDFSTRKLPFKTSLSEEERTLLKKNYPDLEGRDVVLILLDPDRRDWLQNAAIYQYTVAGDELSLRPAIRKDPVRYRRMPVNGR